jgi:hypothetical protein
VYVHVRRRKIVNKAIKKIVNTYQLFKGKIGSALLSKNTIDLPLRKRKPLFSRLFRIGEQMTALSARLLNGGLPRPKRWLAFATLLQLLDRSRRPFDTGLPDGLFSNQKSQFW